MKVETFVAVGVGSILGAVVLGVLMSLDLAQPLFKWPALVLVALGTGSMMVASYAPFMRIPKEKARGENAPGRTST